MAQSTLKVGDVTKNQVGGVYFVAPGTTVTATARAMKEMHISAIVIARETGDGLELLGIVSEKDISHFVANGKALPKRTAIENIMTHQVVTCVVDDLLYEVAQTMMARNIRHIPVVNDSGHPVNMVSIKDVLALLLKHMEGQVTNLEDNMNWMRQVIGQ